MLSCFWLSPYETKMELTMAIRLRRYSIQVSLSDRRMIARMTVTTGASF